MNTGGNARWFDAWDRWNAVSEVAEGSRTGGGVFLGPGDVASFQQTSVLVFDPSDALHDCWEWVEFGPGSVGCPTAGPAW